MALTLTDFRNHVLDNVDDVSQDSFGNARLDRLINRAKDWVGRELSDVDEGYNVTTTTWAISAAVTTQSLPTDIRQPLYMARVDCSPHQRCTIIDWRDQRKYQRSAYERTRWPSAYPVAYFWHNEVRFFGVDAAMSIALDYSYIDPDLTITTSTLSNAAMDHAVVLGATYMALQQENAPDAAAWKAQYDQEMQHLRETWTQRSRQGPRYVRMVDVR